MLAINLICAFAASSQQLVSGQLQDSLTNEPVQFAHVNNITSNQMNITDVAGYFRIHANVGDTIVFSIVGYQKLGWEVKPGWFDQQIQLKLPQDQLLLDEITISNIPSEEVFKRRLIEHIPQDTGFWYHGMSEPKPYDDSPISEKQLNNPLFAIMQPTDFLYQKFSKQAKEERKYHQVLQRESITQRVHQKFTRDWVQNVTGLEGDKLTSFIYYCDYSLDYLDRTPLYMIQEDLLAKLEDFQTICPG